MRNEKPNCIGRAARRKPLTLGVLLALLLAVFPLATPGLAAGESGVVPQASLANKPEITIQGNLVVDDSGAPTGFYELALCVRSPKRIVDLKGQTPDPADPGKNVAEGTEITETAYNAYLAAHSGAEGDFTVTYYPFAAASAVVEVNADVLTAVDWDVEQVTYDAWDAGTNAYAKPLLDNAYPRGIDRDANTDPDLWPTTGPAPFPDITTATLSGLHREPVALDVEGDRSTFTATAQVDDYLQGANTKTALVTLSAYAPDNKPVIYTQSTPVAVVRFSYDLQRFPKNTVMVSASGVTGTASDQGFWLGLDRGHNNTVTNGKTPLTWLANTALGSGGSNYDYSDARAASTGAGQVVWTKISSRDTDGAPVADWDSTEYYYYLGAENPAGTGAEGSVPVALPGADAPTTVDHVWVPKTASQVKVLVRGTAANPQPGPGDGWTQAQYSYYSNIIKLNDGLRLELVNAPTFRPKTGTGTGGNQILFYDWDDTLIGSLIVGDGDVRQEVNDYLENNLVHPDLRVGNILKNDFGGTVPDQATLTVAGPDSSEEKYLGVLDSLDREYTYRGKYPYELGGSKIQDDESALPGAEYPLTNKLDYAFYRHVNTVTTQEYAGANSETVTERYITADKLSANQDAARYPWVYGWTVVEDNGVLNQTDWQVRRDALRKEDVWTTFGTGELEDLDPSADLTAGGQAIPLPPVSGTSGTTYPAFVDPATATAPTNYSYLLSSEEDADYLRFADFSDIGGAFARPGQNTLIVKAVYEPGTSLTEGSYRMSQEPYYNKLNRLDAASGGAYSVELAFERANVYSLSGYLQGVKRMRAPAIRQDTTPDLHWEEAEAGVPLTNASSDDALTGKTKVTYTNVTVDNGEELSVTLTLTARQNKVDYILTETYNNNYVSGGQRAENNRGQGRLSPTAFAVDNYNYYVNGESDEGDDYYDVPGFDQRAGSRGFVLYGTLNSIMEKATQYNHGEIDQGEFNRYTDMPVLADANLKNSDGNDFTDRTLTAARTSILAAAQACEAQRGDPDYWNSDKDCAELSYHQLQLYITTGTLYSRTAADAITVNWCHLHADCAATMSGTPKSWAELLAAAQGQEPEVIEKLTTGEIERLTHLRQSEAGALFSSSAAFRDALVAAVKAGASDWKSIQYHILKGSVPGPEDTTAQENYWWYDGATGNTVPGSLSALVTAAQDALTPADLPDGTTSTMNAKLNAAQSAFDANAAGDAVAPAWNRMTENLVKKRVVEDEGERTEKFDSFQEFRDAFLEALRKAQTAGADPGADPDLWEKIQYLFLNPEQDWPGSKPEESTGYWWKDGKNYLKIKDLVSLLEAVQRAKAGEEGARALLDALSPEDLYRYEGLHFRTNFHGDKYDEGTIVGFRTALEAFVDLEGAVLPTDATKTTDITTAWNQIQHYLIHPDPNRDYSSRDALIALNAEKEYYWWRDGKEGEAYTLTPGVTDANIKALMEALYRDVVNGNTMALDGLTEAAAERYRLIPTYAGSEADWDALTKYDGTGGNTAAALKGKLRAMWAAGSLSAETYQSVSWRQIQHYLLTGNWLDAASPDLPSDGPTEKGAYWWKTGDANPDAASEPIPSKLDELLALFNDRMAKRVAGDKTTASDTAFKNLLDSYLSANGIYGGTASSPQAYDGLVTTTKNTIKTRYVNLIKNFVDKQKKTDAYEVLDWYVIQYYALNNVTATTATLKTKAEAKEWFESTLAPKGITPPSFADDPPIRCKVNADGSITYDPAAGAALFGGTPVGEETELEQAREAVEQIRAALPALRLLAPEAAEEMERALVQAEEELARLEAQAVPQTAPAGSAPSSDPDPDPDQTSDDHDLRPEIPLGEEAASAQTPQVLLLRWSPLAALWQRF